MTLIDALLTRRSTSVKQMQVPGPDAAALETLLTIATRVPDHGKLAPWRIQILEAEGQARLGDFLGDLFAAETPQATEKQVEFERARPRRTPLLLVVTAKLQPDHKIPVHEQLLSGGAVCFALLAGAHGLGYAAQWLTEWPAYRPEVVRFLGHDPETDRILGFIHLGTAVAKPEERPRPALSEIASHWAGPDASRPFAPLHPTPATTP